MVLSGWNSSWRKKGLPGTRTEQRRWWLSPGTWGRDTRAAKGENRQGRGLPGRAGLGWPAGASSCPREPDPVSDTEPRALMGVLRVAHTAVSCP